MAFPPAGRVVGHGSLPAALRRRPAGRRSATGFSAIRGAHGADRALCRRLRREHDQNGFQTLPAPRPHGAPGFARLGSRRPSVGSRLQLPPAIGSCNHPPDVSTAPRSPFDSRPFRSAEHTELCSVYIVTNCFKSFRCCSATAVSEGRRPRWAGDRTTPAKNFTSASCWPAKRSSPNMALSA